MTDARTFEERERDEEKRRRKEREREREREKASDYGDDNESAALERKGGWAEKARSEVSTLLSNSSYFV